APHQWDDTTHINLIYDLVSRRPRPGPLQQLHPVRSRLLVRYHDCLHGNFHFARSGNWRSGWDYAPPMKKLSSTILPFRTVYSPTSSSRVRFWPFGVTSALKRTTN